MICSPDLASLSATQEPEKRNSSRISVFSLVTNPDNEGYSLMLFQDACAILQLFAGREVFGVMP